MTADARIAIIGAGIAGCTAALFVRDALPNALITVLEGEERVGGRIYTGNFQGHTTELGAGFIHSSNRILMNLVHRLGLEQRHNDTETIDIRPVGIWDGKSFVVTLPDRHVGLIIRLLSRYGFSLFRIRRLATIMLRQWSQVYELQKQGLTFASPLELLHAVGLSDLVKRDTYELLKEHRIGGLVVSELFNGISRAIFNQDASVNGFAGMVALVATGLAGGRTLSIEGGNIRLCRNLLDRARTDLQTGRSVMALRSGSSRAGRSVTLLYEDGHTDVFDAVIVAAQTHFEARIDEGQDTYYLRPPENTHITHITCIAGRLLPQYFRLRRCTALPRSILTTTSEQIPFSTIIRIDDETPTSMGIYKLQSHLPIDGRAISNLFSTVRAIHRTSWPAYPKLTPRQTSPLFRLTKGIYHVNAMESVVSTLETQTVASQNVVAMMLQDLAA